MILNFIAFALAFSFSLWIFSHVYRAVRTGVVRHSNSESKHDIRAQPIRFVLTTRLPFFVFAVMAIFYAFDFAQNLYSIFIELSFEPDGTFRRPGDW